MELLDVLGLSRPVADSAVCLEIYHVDCDAGGDPAAALDALKLRCMQLLQPHLECYLWQQEPLRLHSSVEQPPPWVLRSRGAKHPHEPAAQHRSHQRDQQQQQPPCLWGVVRYGDNVEDEWFVVWLLLHLTRQVAGLAARCWDDDGEFLLIEAAYTLPRWLKPETATNRVWLHAGELHIVPPPSAKAPALPRVPGVGEALAVVRGGSVATRRKTVEACITERLAGYPDKAAQQLQRVVAWVPRRLGLVLQQDHQIVAPAVAAFMTRQRNEVQAAAKFALLPPTDMTAALVTLNRCMYAQLLQAEFAPPKGYPAPPGSALGGSAAQQHKALGFGAKLATGMELLGLRLGLTAAAGAAQAGGAAAAGQQQQQQAQEEQPRSAAAGAQAALAAAAPQQRPGGAAALRALAANPAWQSYLAVLERSGYFDGELEGSARHRQLLAAAQEAFVGSEAHARSSAALAAPQQRLQQLLAAADAGGPVVARGAAAASGDAGSGRAGQQPSPMAAVLDVPDASQADGDTWMAAEAEHLQQQLQQAEALAAARAAKKQQHRGPRSAAAAAAAAGGQGPEVDADQLLSGFKGFVQAMAGPEGAEVPGAATQPAASQATAPSGSGSLCGGGGGGASGPPQGAARRPRAGAAAAAAAAAHAAAGRDALAADAGGAAGDADRELDVDGAAALMELLNLLHDPAWANLAGPADSAPLQALQEVQQQLERALAGADAPAGGWSAVGAGDDGPSDDYGSSSGDESDEASSFYGSGSDSDDGVAGAAGGAAVQPPPRPLQQQQQQRQQQEAEQLPVPPPVLDKRGRQQQQGQRQPQQPQQQQQRGLWQQRLQDWEFVTAPDSDDEEQDDGDDDDEDGLSLGGSSDDVSDGSEAGGPAAAGPGSSSGRRGADAPFLEAYGAAMEAELGATTLAHTFERAAPGPAATGPGAPAPAGPAAAAAADAADAGLSPLDLDFNLLKSLVDSYVAQGGLPGPASTLAGLMGLALPHELVVEAGVEGGGGGGSGRAQEEEEEDEAL